MKNVLVIITIAFLSLVSCSNSKKENIAEDLFYYTSSQIEYNDFCRDTFSLKNLRFHRNEDSLVTSLDFKLKNKTHQIRMYTNFFDSKIALDGGGIFYELDNIGVIYSKNDYSCFYNRLRSTNDSINEIINTALENIIAYPRLHNIDHLMPKEETVEFPSPIIETK